jgi:thioredoxin-disulfide reductase
MLASWFFGYFNVAQGARDYYTSTAVPKALKPVRVMPTAMADYDVVIVGAGAAGMTAAIYACRKGLSTLVISKDIGGQTTQTNHIENYPGVDAMPGLALMDKFKETAEKFGATFETNSVSRIDKSKDGTFTIALEEGKHTARAVVLAFGREARRLGIPGEDQFWGRGVATCVTCDAPLYRNKTVAVVGGGNAALEGVLELAPVAKQVYLIHRRDEFRADEITEAKVKAEPRITLLLNKVPVEVKGEKSVTAVMVKDLPTGQVAELPVDGVFLEIGHIVDSSPVKDLVRLNEQGEILVDENGRTSCPGVFACGDVTPVKYKQTVISAGQGAIAALEAHSYLSGLGGKR